MNIGSHRKSILIVAFGLIMLAELALRVPAIRDFLPPPRPYYSDAVETRLNALRALQNSGKTVDVLFIGSSVVRSNIRPLVFDSLVQLNQAIDLISFNGGFTGMHVDPVRLYAENFWLVHTNPSVIVHGVRLGELQSGIDAGSFDRFRNGIFENAWGNTSVIGFLKRSLLRISRLYYYQGTLPDFIRGVRFPMNKPRGRTIDSRGYSRHEKEHRIVNEDGELIFSPYERIEMSQETLPALKYLADMAKIASNKGITYVVASIPEHPDKYGNDLSLLRDFDNYVQSYLDDQGIRFIPSTEFYKANRILDSLYSDKWHMNESGAKKYSEMLALSLSDVLRTK